MIDVVHPLSTLLDIFEHLVMAVSLCEECGSVGGTQSESLCKRWSLCSGVQRLVQYYKFTEFCTINSTTLDILNSQHNRDHNEPKHLDSVCSERGGPRSTKRSTPTAPRATAASSTPNPADPLPCPVHAQPLATQPHAPPQHHPIILLHVVP